jgi:thiopeptide-type bacteriocin biosynthesis protein
LEGTERGTGALAADRGVLTYVRRQARPIGRRELSILLITAMTAAAGLDWFERGDVFDRVAQLRPDLPTGSADRLKQLTSQLRQLLAAPLQTLLADLGFAEIATPWLSTFEHAGRQFSTAADQQLLTRGTRAVLAHAIIFHWNRLGLPATTQAILAHAASAACLPRG